MTSSANKRMKTLLSLFVWWLMAFSAVASLVTIGTFPLVKATMLGYKAPDADCIKENCDMPICVINGTTLGSEFGNVDNYYTVPICSCALLINIFLVMRIFGSRFVNIFLSTFAFFCLIVFPVRFVFLAMQTLEFTSVGGDFYTLLLLDPEQYNCPLFSDDVDAVFLMHLRFILLVIDFFTFHALIVSVPLFYVDDKISSEKYETIDDKMDVFTRAASVLMFADV